MWVRAAADLILPRRCIVCDRKLNLNERHLCLGCLADIPLTRFWIIRHNLMADRFNEIIQKNQEVYGSPRERYAFATALFFYDSEASYRKIPYRIKYHGDLAAGRHFGKMLGEHLSRCRMQMPSFLFPFIGAEDGNEDTIRQKSSPERSLLP